MKKKQENKGPTGLQHIWKKKNKETTTSHPSVWKESNYLNIHFLTS